MEIPNVTLLQLQERVNRLVAQNASSADRAERNNLPVQIRINQFGKLRRSGRRSFKSTFAPVTCVNSSMITLGDGVQCMTVECELPDAK